MKKPHGIVSASVKWTRSEVMAEARKYTTRSEWSRKSPESYAVGFESDYFDKACAHMPYLRPRAGAALTAEPLVKPPREELSA